MLMPKRNRNKIYEYLFKEGVIVAKKDFSGIKHPHVTDVPNLHVIKALQSLTSRAYVKEQFAWRHYYWSLTNEGNQYLRDYLHLPPEIVPITLKRIKTSLTSRAYVKEQFAWRHYYWSLTNEGIQYLRDYLHLPPEIVPATLKRQTRPEPARGPGGPGMGRGAMGYKDGSDRDSYRRGPGGGGGGGFDKQAEAGAGGASVEFRGGFGRGKPAE